MGEPPVIILISVGFSLPKTIQLLGYSYDAGNPQMFIQDPISVSILTWPNPHLQPNFSKQWRSGGTMGTRHCPIFFDGPLNYGRPGEI